MLSSVFSYSAYAFRNVVEYTVALSFSSNLVCYRASARQVRRTREHDVQHHSVAIGYVRSERLEMTKKCVVVVGESEQRESASDSGR